MYDQCMEINKHITDKSVQIKFVSFYSLCKNRKWLRINESRITNQIRHESDANHPGIH